MTVIEVEVPVQVLRDGLPVRGLRDEDFVVLDRGRERALTGFQVVDLAAPPADPRSTESESPGAAAAAEARSLLVIFDLRYTSAGLLARAVGSVRTLLDEQLQPADRVAVVVAGSSRAGARILSGFTGDRARTHLALDLVQALLDRKPKRQRELVVALAESAPRTADARAIAYGEAASVAFGEGLASVAIEFDTTLDTSMANEVLSSLGRFESGAAEAFEVGARLGAYQHFQYAARFAEGLGNLGALLRGVEGQKMAMLLSQGPPMSHLSAFAGPGAPDGAALVAAAMEDMFELLGRSGWRLFTFGQRLEVDVPAGESLFKGSLFYFARETGGLAYESYNRLDVATARFLEQTSVTYVLHFLADDLSLDGRRHQLEVRLREPLPGVTVTHRPAYYAPRPADQLGDVERRIAAAEHELERRARLEAHALVLRVPGTEPGTERAWILVEIDRDELERLVAGAAGRLELYAKLGGGAAAPELHLGVELDPAKIELPRDGTLLVADLALPAGDARVRVGLRAAGESGPRAAAWDFALPASAGDGEWPPLFVVAGKERWIVRESEDGRPIRGPLVVASRELLPHLLPEVTAGDRLGVLLATTTGAADTLEPAATGTTVQAALLATDGGVAGTVELEVEAVERSGDLRLVLAVLEIAGLEPGDYVLRAPWPSESSRPSATFRVLAPRHR